MKKIAFLIALVLSVGIWGCEDKEENKIECYKLYDEKLQENDFSKEGVVIYSEEYKEFVLAYYTTWEHEIDFADYYLFCPQLEPKYCKEGIKLKVKGKLYLGTEPDKNGNRPKGGALMGAYRFKDYTITKIK